MTYCGCFPLPHCIKPRIKKSLRLLLDLFKQLNHAPSFNKQLGKNLTLHRADAEIVNHCKLTNSDDDMKEMHGKCIYKETTFTCRHVNVTFFTVDVLTRERGLMWCHWYVCYWVGGTVWAQTDIQTPLVIWCPTYCPRFHSVFFLK